MVLNELIAPDAKFPFLIASIIGAAEPLVFAGHGEVFKNFNFCLLL